MFSGQPKVCYTIYEIVHEHEDVCGISWNSSKYVVLSNKKRTDWQIHQNNNGQLFYFKVLQPRTTFFKYC